MSPSNVVKYASERPSLSSSHLPRKAIDCHCISLTHS